MVANINRRTRIVLMDEGVREERAICQLTLEALEQLALVAAAETDTYLTRITPLVSVADMEAHERAAVSS